jgi:hypothetical protein
MTNIELIKKIYGLNTYTKAIDTDFEELIPQEISVTSSVVTVDEFFNYYDNLFFDIPVSGSINSHTYLVERSQEYIGGSVIDAEKQALIEEINSLRQQILDINQSLNDINNIV